MLHIKLVLLLLLIGGPQESKQVTVTDSLPELSQAFLKKLQDGESTAAIREKLKNLSLQELETGLGTDREKLAFWINIYNAYIIQFLQDNPELYDNRSEFFKEEQIPIAGRKISFEKIEHGIIRKSQWPYGLGYIRKWFPNRFERKLRVEDRDYRIHFALNCGAKDCPPVAIYTPEQLNTQLEKSTEAFLEKTTEYDRSTNTVKVTPLFRWFRGDFCPPGITKVLKRHGVLAEEVDPDVEFRNYDWTLELGNYTKL